MASMFSTITILIFLLVGYTTFIHMIYISTIRYRVPLMPFLLLFAAYGFLYACGRIKAKRPEPTYTQT